MTHDKDLRRDHLALPDSLAPMPAMPGHRPDMPDVKVDSRTNAGEADSSIPVASERAITGNPTRPADPADPNALLRMLDLDFETYEPVQRSRPQRSLWMAAQTSSVSYRGTLTGEMLLELLTGGKVPAGFAAHLGHFLDEVPVDMVVMAVAEAAQRSGTPIQTVWRNVAALALQHSGYRRALWTRYWPPPFFRSAAAGNVKGLSGTVGFRTPRTGTGHLLHTCLPAPDSDPSAPCAITLPGQEGDGIAT
jgi:hypothetical protein